jgi:hypothetical protein
MHPILPKQTVHDLTDVIRTLTSRAVQALKLLLERLAPWVRPPDDMEVRCRDGSQFTGVLVIEGNDVQGGAVVRTGQEAAPAPYNAPRPPARPWSSADDDRSRLTHWAMDDREQEDPPWARR